MMIRQPRDTDVLEDEAMPDTGTEIAVAAVAQPPALAPEQPKSLLPAIMEMARDKSVDVSKLKEILAMQRELEADQAKRDFTAAYARLSAALPRVKKNGTIDLGNKRSIAFAKWEDMDTVVRPLMTAEGFTISFNSAPLPADQGGGLLVTGELMHITGHSRTASMPLPFDNGPGRNNLQARGSTLSYGKRYCAEMLLNIVREGADDDGNKGGMKFASPEKVEEIRALLKDTGTDEEGFCRQWFNVMHLAELPEINVTPALNMLLAKKNKKAAS